MPHDPDSPKPKRVRASRSAARPRSLGKAGRGLPYLWWRPGRVDADGVDRNGRWWIVHKGRQVRSTGCGTGAGEDRQALVELDAYKASLIEAAKPEAAGPRKNRAAGDVPIAEVLARYLVAKKGRADPKTGEVKGGVARHHELAQRVESLLTWWGERTLDDVDSVSCAAYVASRVGTPWKTHARAGLDRDGAPRADAAPVRRGHSRPTKARVVSEGGVRRELEDFRAAVNLALTDGLTREVVKVSLPAKSEARDRWLTKAEAARLVLAAWRKREVQTVHRGERKGERVEGRRVGRHLARYLLVALRTGTRSGPICAASFMPEVGRPWMELREEDGKRVALFHRKALGAAAKKNKRAPTVRMPDALTAHLWRWHHVLGQRYVVEWQGKPVGSTKRSFANLVHELGLGDDVVRHSLRHTAVTWGVQAGTDLWELSGYVGMTVEMIERRYGHHATDHMEEARAAMGGRRRKRAA